MPPPPPRYEQPRPPARRGTSRTNTKASDPSDISHYTGPAKVAGKWVSPPATTAQFTPYGTPGGTRLKDLFPQLAGGGGSRRGGGGGYGSARAAEDARRAAMRAAIEAQFGGAIGSLGTTNQEVMNSLGQWFAEAQARANPIYAQNRALTGGYSQQLADLAQNASRGVLDQGDMLTRDLLAQGAGTGSLQDVISGDVRDILGARSAGDQYNTRLAQVMGLSETDNAALLNALLFAGQSQRENTYQQQLARLRAEQAMALAELA